MPKLTTTSAGCGDAAEAVPSRSCRPIRLAAFAQSITTAQRFQRTTDYLRNPDAYLRHVLGEDTFTGRKNLLHISPDYNPDVYGFKGHKTHFEQHIAKILGKKHGLFFITGVQAQTTALKIHCARAKNPKGAWHITSHLEGFEERAFEELFGLQRSLIGNDERVLPTVDEVLALIHDDTSEKPAAILLEVPSKMLGCATWTYDELQRISEACRRHSVALHMDGARFWDVMPYYEQNGRSISEVTSMFDSIYVSMYKGLEGAAGAMLLSDDIELVKEARVWQRRAGGNPCTLVYETIDCERGFNENIGSFGSKWEKMKDVTTKVRQATNTFKNSTGRDIIKFSPEDPICCQTRTMFDGYSVTQLIEARDKVEKDTNVRVFETLSSKYTLDEKLAADRSDQTLEDRFGDRESMQHEIGWTITSETEKLDTDIFVQAYVNLCRALLAMS